jgi:hypothetical protein
LALDIAVFTEEKLEIGLRDFKDCEDTTDHVAQRVGRKVAMFGVLTGSWK